MNIIDRFLYKLLILTFIFLSVIVFENKGIVKHELIENELTRNFNLLKVKSVLFGSNDDVKKVIKSNDCINVSNNNGGYTVFLNDGNIYSETSLCVTKISKTNNKYNLYCLDEFSNEIVFYNLDKVYVKLYNIIGINELIGKASINKINENYLYYYDYLINEN